MPPIKRNQKSVTPPARRRLAGHTGTTRPESTSLGRENVDRGTSQYTGDRGPDTNEAPRRRPVGYLAVSAALAVGLAAGIAGGFLLVTHEPVADAETSNQAFVDAAATDAVLSAATSSVQRLVAIDHTELDAYHESLGEFLTQDLVDELDSNWPALRDSYEQSATTVDATVREAGLSFLEGDHAEVLLVQEVSMSRDGSAAGSTSGTYLVGMERIDGVWKLSKIPDLPS